MIDKKAEMSSQETETGRVVNLLTSILEEFRKQVQSKTPKPLEGEALRAVEQFREITASLALQRGPTITLTPNWTEISPGQSVTLTWVWSEARAVSLERKFGEVTEKVADLTPESGSIENAPPILPTTYTATATGRLCGTATDQVTIKAINVR